MKKHINQHGSLENTAQFNSQPMELFDAHEYLLQLVKILLCVF